jgi:long-chain acyl-CoA synthetase
VRPRGAAGGVEIAAFRRDRLAARKRPRYVESAPFERTPRSATGKLQKRELAKRPLGEDRKTDPSKPFAEEIAMDRMTERNLIQRVNVGDMLTRSAARAPNDTAIVDGERRFAYAEFNAFANRTAHALERLGCRRGDALALMSTNNAEFLAVYYACAKLGVICVPINLFWRHKELGYVLSHARVKLAVVESALIEQLQTGLDDAPGLSDIVVIGAAPRTGVAGRRTRGFSALVDEAPAHEPEVYVEDRDPISYLYTSGTTSAPKGVVSSHLAVYIESLGVAIDTRLSAKDRMAAMMPLFHTAQLNAFATPAVAVGAAIHILRGFDAPRLLDLIEREGLTLVFGLPMMFRALVEEQDRRARDVGSLRLAVYAMAPMPTHELKNAMAKLGCEFALMFGQTEMNPLSVYFRPEHQLSHAGAVGTPAPNAEVAIMDAEGRFLKQGEAGEIVYRGPQVMSEYLRDEAATEAAFKHGWFHSGDCGRFDADGVLWFEDRFKDVIKTGGENVASIEVEKALYAADPGVQEAAVVGLPHERWGEAVTAIVVLREGAEVRESDLLAKLHGHLSPFKCPKRVLFTKAMPKTATGKIQKAKLRTEYARVYAETAPK